MALLLEIKNFLSNNFEMKDLEDTSFMIDIQIQGDKTRGILGLSQKTYVNKVLDRRSMKNYSKGDKLSLLQYAKNDLQNEQWKTFHVHRLLKVWYMLKFVLVQT